MTESQEKIAENCTLWVIKTKGWAATGKLAPEDMGLREEDVSDIFRLGRKYLIPDEWRIRLNQPRGKVTYGLEKVIKAKRYIVSSIWAVPNSKLEMTDQWIDKLIQEQKEVVEDFLISYDTIKGNMIEKYPSLENADYPSPESIRNEFKIEPIVFEIGTTRLNKADPEQLIKIKQKYAEKYETNVKELTNLYVEKAHQQIIDTCKDITNRIMDGGKRVTKTTLKKPMELVKEYEAIASMFDDSEIKEEVEKLRVIVSSTSASQIREKGPIAEGFAEAIATIGKNIGDLSGVSADGRVKRQLKFEGSM